MMPQLFRLVLETQNLNTPTQSDSRSVGVSMRCLGLRVGNTLRGNSTRHPA